MYLYEIYSQVYRYNIVLKVVFQIIDETAINLLDLRLFTVDKS